MQTVTLDGKKLKDICHRNRTAEVTTLSLAMRERLRHFSDIGRTRNALVRQGEKIVDGDYMQYWKDLQAAGVGAIIFGRRGNPNRFEWHYSLKKIAKAALEGTNVEAERHEAEKPAAPAPAPKVIRRSPQAPAPVKTLAQKTVFIPLRSNFDLEIKLPGDVNAQEIETITKALARATA